MNPIKGVFFFFVFFFTHFIAGLSHTRHDTTWCLSQFTGCKLVWEHRRWGSIMVSDTKAYVYARLLCSEPPFNLDMVEARERATLRCGDCRGWSDRKWRKTYQCQDEERKSGVNLINNAELFRGDQPAAGAAYFMSNFTLQYSQAVSTFWYTRARILGKI